MRPALPLGALLLLASIQACKAGDADLVGFEPLAKGKTMAIRGHADFVVARTPQEWKAAWLLPSTGQQGPPAMEVTNTPAVRFPRDMVLGVVGAAAGNSCTAVDIQAVRHEGAKLVVEYQARRPRPGELCLAAFFSPYAFVTVAASAQEVSFREVTAR